MTAQITQAEIDMLKSQFEGKIGNYSIAFKKDEEGEEIPPMVYNGESGEDAYWSGSIILEQSFIFQATIYKSASTPNVSTRRADCCKP